MHLVVHLFTGYNQSVTGFGNQPRHVVVTQRKSCKQHDPYPQIEFTFVEKHNKNVCGAQRRPL